MAAAAGNSAVSGSASAFWQQARQLPHMNTFNMNNSMVTAASGHASAMVSGASGMGHMGHHHSAAAHVNPAAQPHDAKMAEKIVSELQVILFFKSSGNYIINYCFSKNDAKMVCFYYDYYISTTDRSESIQKSFN